MGFLLLLVSHVSSSVRVTSGNVLLAFNDKKYGTQKPHLRIIAIYSKTSPPYTSRFDITHAIYSNYLILTIHVNHITSEAMSNMNITNEEAIPRKSFVNICLSYNTMKDYTINVTRGFISLAVFRAVISGYLKKTRKCAHDR